MPQIISLKNDLKKLADQKKKEALQSFFKTGPGQYAEGDIFLGVTVPKSRSISLKYKDLSLSKTKQLLSSKIHEERLVAILILVYQFETGDEKTKKDIFNFYLKHTKQINNWDLVDLSADKIVGAYLYQTKQETSTLLKLAHSENLWERRVAILSTFHFIKQNQSKETLKIAEVLLNDKHDLIHKAVGWMLREVGKRCSQVEEEKFLKKHLKQIPRTTLRYAIEHFPEEKRLSYLHN
jgi:3-methyladenine DNA glycosylase AlkD